MMSIECGILHHSGTFPASRPSTACICMLSHHAFINLPNPKPERRHQNAQNLSFYTQPAGFSHCSQNCRCLFNAFHAFHAVTDTEAGPVYMSVPSNAIICCVSVFCFISNTFAHSISGSVESYGLFAPESGRSNSRSVFSSLNCVLFYFALIGECRTSLWVQGSELATVPSKILNPAEKRLKNGRVQNFSLGFA